MLKKILIGVGAVLVLFVGVVATRPAKYRVERNVNIAAPADVVYAQLEDFHKWNAWSPWGKLDPNQKETYSGSAKGKDAVYHWSGNDDVGEGEMKILAVDQNKRLDVQLNFIRPFPSEATVDFVLTPAGTETKVVWGIDGKNDFMGKLFGMLVDMDTMLGNDFSKGLTQLKGVSEAEVVAAQKKVAEAAPAAAAVEPTPAAK